MSDLFNEVNDDLRREKLEKFWEENKAFILSCIIAAILGTAGATYWKSTRLTQNLEATSAFYDAFQTNDVDQIATYANGAKKNHAALAKLASASLFYKRSRPEDGLKMLQAIQNDKSIDKTYRELAVLSEASHTMDTADLAMLEKKLIPLSDKSSTWHLSANEFLAVIAAQQEKYTKAIEILAIIKDSDIASQNMKERAKQLTELYQAKHAQQQPTQ